jgi:hypothetical protein
MNTKTASLFRPNGYSKIWMMKERRQGSPYGFGGLSFQKRINWHPASMTNHQIQFARRFSHLHYLACHAPDPVARKWKQAYNLFMRKYFADGGKHSMRFANSHTCHKWL